MRFLEVEERFTGIRASSSAPSAAPASVQYADERAAHYDRLATRFPRPPLMARYYHEQVRQIYRYLVSPGQRVLEIGCGAGDLLAAVNPSVGVGVDFSSEALRQARARHPDLRFVQADAQSFELDETFDVILLSDLVNDLWDVQALFACLHSVATPRTRVVLNFFSRLWQVPLSLVRHLGLGRPMLPENWLSVEDVTNLLHLADFEVLRSWGEIIFPMRLPVFDSIANRFLARLPIFRSLALTSFVVARPCPREEPAAPRVSVIVPARNEAGNIAKILRRTPELGAETELVFVEGHSRDDTFETIEREISRHPHKRCVRLRQSGIGKGDAVREGFAAASGDVLVILDADLTVAPEDLPGFVRALISGKGDFINGVRLVYPMEKRAMRPLNHLGNKFFSMAFSWLLGQPVKDTLCGTKVLWKRDYEKIAANRSYFGDFDPFGDFDLLFGAAKQNLKVVDLPIRYRERTYGTTNIQRWRHGWLLLKMVAFGARRMKFF
jgi:ubiquinone/menaquinone biosynthesis C-methylase UbiE